MPITHPLPPDGQNPWGDTFRLWAGDVETSIEASGGIGEVRSDTTDSYSYMGTAPTDTAESAATWAVTRIQLLSPPVVGHATGAWSNRAALTYT